VQLFSPHQLQILSDNLLHLSIYDIDNLGLSEFDHINRIDLDNEKSDYILSELSFFESPIPALPLTGQIPSAPTAPQAVFSVISSTIVVDPAHPAP